ALVRAHLQHHQPQIALEQLPSPSRLINPCAHTCDRHPCRSSTRALHTHAAMGRHPNHLRSLSQDSRAGLLRARPPSSDE
ncbi:unnamed protein product, partial [Tilletia caries]